MDKEEQQEIVRDFTQSILLRSGSTGGNKNLFVNSKEAFFPSTRAANSPLGMATTSNSPSGFFAQTDMNGSGNDYKTLKKNFDTQKGSNVLNNRSSSISMVRIEREFSPVKRKGSLEAAMAAE